MNCTIFSFVLKDEQKWIGEAMFGNDITEYWKIFYSTAFTIQTSSDLHIEFVSINI